ncbi:hypothetical protein Dda_5618 [Drechslerella dactyloides]|uniref:F-box domain-containing protein n=1 Tax=Drechslerella dactyloides TaxID=74499 RepID=A0AAD6NIW3_DREDA|nr:hypothetical protein Dda_5618 [Drechslerella dactyloides]
MDDDNNNNDNDGHDPNDILNPSFIDLFVEEAPPQWTIEDRHALSVIRGEPERAPAPFQRLPVELVEHIAFELVQFRDIRAMAGTCTLFHQILFGSGNHIFWFRWAGAPHSMCRWDLGTYRQNRAYQNTIVNQQSGRRRKRCQLCMAPAIKGEVFKMKTCMDCWEDIGMPAKDLYFLQSIDITGIPHEYASHEYIDVADRGIARRDWDLLFFFKPGNLRRQFEEAMDAPGAADRASSHLLEFTRTVFNEVHLRLAQLKRTMGWRYRNYYSYGTRPKEKWYTASIEDLVCPHEVVHRVLESTLCAALGGMWMNRGNYCPLPLPEDTYGPYTEFCASFPKTKCELQTEPAYLDEFGNDPSNLHGCDIECQRESRAKLFRKTWWPAAEERLLRALIGDASVTLTAAEGIMLQVSRNKVNFKETLQDIVDAILRGCKWVVPGVIGDFTAESVDDAMEEKSAFNDRVEREFREGRLKEWLLLPRKYSFHWLEAEDLGKRAFTIALGKETYGYELGKDLLKLFPEDRFFEEPEVIASDHSYEIGTLDISGLEKRSDDVTNDNLVEVRRDAFEGLPTLSEPKEADWRKVPRIGTSYYDYKNPGEGVVVYVIDSGLNETHPDFKDLKIQDWITPGHFPSDKATATVSGMLAMYLSRNMDSPNRITDAIEKLKTSSFKRRPEDPEPVTVIHSGITLDQWPEEDRQMVTHTSTAVSDSSITGTDARLLR